MLLASAALIFVLGGVSLVLDNPIFFKWKPTGLYWLFAVVFLGSQFIGEKPLVRRMMNAVAEDEFNLPERVWKQLNLAWAVYFVLSGTANIIVAYRFEEAVWVNFKLFGLLGITLVFLILQSLWLSRYMNDADNEGS